MSNEDIRIHDVTTTLRSELAALQYKRDRLLSELQDVKSQLKIKEQRVGELQTETEHLKEQAARQNAIITSLRNRVQELEERERTLNNALTRTEMSMETLTRENRYQNEKIKEIELKMNHLDMERSTEEQNKKYTQRNMIDVVNRLASALGAEPTDCNGIEAVTQKASELIQDVSLLRNKNYNLTDALSTVESELRSCRDQLERMVTERDNLKRQTSSHLLEMEKIKRLYTNPLKTKTTIEAQRNKITKKVKVQKILEEFNEGLEKEKETLENKNIILERELSELKDNLQLVSRGLNTAATNISSQETTISSLKGELKQKEENIQEVQNELTHLLETLAIIMSTPTHFVEPKVSTIKDRVKEIVYDVKEKSMELDDLKTKYMSQSQQYTFDNEIRIQEKARLKSLEEEKLCLETRLHRTESELASCELAKENLKRDKVIFVTFLDRLSRTLNMDEISKEVGIELHTESILLRTEQLAKLESGKTIDKSAVVYQLQKRVRTLREQLQRRDLHLDLLRKKINLQEENTRVRSLLEAEKEDANQRAKKLQKQNDKLQLQLNEAKSIARELRSQVIEADEFKTKAVERGHKIEELQKKINESEALRIRYLEKLTSLKDQLRMTSETCEQDRTMNEHTIKMLKEELLKVKQCLTECQRSEHLLAELRRSIISLLGLEASTADYEIVSKLSKLVNAHREYTLVTRRYDDPIPAITSEALSPRYPNLEHGTTNRFLGLDNSRYYASLLDDIETDINTSFNKRPTRNL